MNEEYITGESLKFTKPFTQKNMPLKKTWKKWRSITVTAVSIIVVRQCGDKETRYEN